MSTIIAGMFWNIVQAENAAESLRRHHFADHDVCHFVNDPGGAAAASGGSPMGRRRPVCVMVAARVDGVAEEQTAIQVLRAESAVHIEKAEGEWSAGRWSDFDPTVEPRLVPAARERDARVYVGQTHQMGSGGTRRGRPTS